MNLRTCLGLLLLLPLSFACDDNRACVDSTECEDGSACVSSVVLGTCLPLCDSQSACEGADFCLPRVEEAPTVVLEWPDVCVPPEMLDFNEPPTGCDARGVDDCDVDGECSLGRGWRIDRTERCLERVGAGCLPLNTACADGTVLTHNTEGELIWFSSRCGPYGFAPLDDLAPGDPLYEELYGGEVSFQTWPECE
ncbi:MAG: hypothetical protein AAGF92_09695 [Myxococcota bacterium]